MTTKTKTNPTLQQLKKKMKTKTSLSRKQLQFWHWFEQEIDLAYQSGVRETVEEIKTKKISDETVLTHAMSFEKTKIYNMAIDDLVSHLSKKTEKVCKKQ